MSRRDEYRAAELAKRRRDLERRAARRMKNIETGRMTSKGSKR